ncbi:RhoGAP-domain-containing protein [Cylindrobasidium torrendii FP15055 ss-10]|uniref:RhoGAP-domain-containing protein n=1 Tax=Cylindrobasidium torrendii FP15055 ss-10 TaxID=1314674 RepID=A0A0D7BUV8_9AGAR|nr:RhoGAP-domain-containing protein [Cylindrobasidium torrendii FP15055 ss-10]
MLATMNMTQTRASLHNNNAYDLGQEHVDVDKICPGCKQSAVTDDGGLVVAFGSSFFHVDCFRCAKCSNRVTADTNLLLLSDGSPVCANCSYNCNVCKQPILDEAIMTGDDSYHAHCFKCKVCRNRIDELVFAKTSQGIYCMDCHNERMIKIRRHAQKKAEREKAAAAGGSGSASSRTSKRDQPPTTPSPMETPMSAKAFPASSAPSPGNPSTPRTPKEPLPQSRGRNGSYVEDAFSPTTPRSATKPSPPQLTPSFSQPPQQPVSVTVAPPPEGNAPLRPPLAHQSSSSSSNGFLQQESEPTSRANKRRSINPGLTLSDLASPPTPPAASSPTLSPMSASFLRQAGGRSPTPPSLNGRDSPQHLASPLREQFDARARPVSNSSIRSDPSRVIPMNVTVQDSESQRPRAMSSVQRVSEREQAYVNGRPSTANGHSAPSRQFSSPHINISSPESNGIRPMRSFDDRQRPASSGSNRAPSIKTSRAPSRAAVPHSIETDTEEGDYAAARLSYESDDGAPPALPPKLDTSFADKNGQYNDVLPDSASDTSEASSPVEQTSHSTFIAPALPPIRFSLNTADFSDLLNSVGGVSALKSLDQLAHLVGEGVPPTPPPTATAPGIPDSSPPVTPKNLDVGGQNDIHATPRPPTADVSENIISTRPSFDSAKHPDSPEPEYVVLRLQQVMEDAAGRGAGQVKLDPTFLSAILKTMQIHKSEISELKSKIDGMKRASKNYIEGISVAQTEYDRELKLRRESEAEVTRLRVLLSGQAARLTALSGDSRKHELRQKMTKDLHEKLSGLETDLSKLTVNRDMALAEVEELAATQSTTVDQRPNTLNRSLTMRLDNLRSQYQQELMPLSAQREALSREIAELKAVRDVFLEETTVLNARNEELAQLSTQYARRVDSLPEARKVEPAPRPSTDRPRPQIPPPQPIAVPLPAQSVFSSSTTLNSDDSSDRLMPKYSKSDAELANSTPSKGKFMKWGSRPKEGPTAMDGRSKSNAEHNFQQLSILRFTRCDHCGDKMWGSQLRCTGCSVSVHVRCLNQVQSPCSHQGGNSQNDQPMPPSMFGRDLVEQVQADSRNTPRDVPVLVEKCIEAVEELAMDYEGIYRKTGGSGQNKVITQLFERGDYDAFDLRDQDKFNDICSVTSVLKTYFRTLPVPLFTYDLHDHFMGAVEIKDSAARDQQLTDLVNQLPREHYFTVRELMLHLSRVCDRAERNLMSARNLGVVFGPTLMRSRNPGAEFSDMAGKALTIEWLVENAPTVFGQR